MVRESANCFLDAGYFSCDHAHMLLQRSTTISTFIMVRRHRLAKLLGISLTVFYPVRLGYHLYAVATVAKFDSAWGVSMFEKSLLFARSIANPSTEDRFFPTFRHKDWFQGHSWASGMIRPPPLNGRNQESSSEAIAAYEAVTLFGSTMGEIFSSSNDHAQLLKARRIALSGKVLLATEIRSVKRYWHVFRSSSVRIYPTEYEGQTIGILWQTMAQLQTWFGNSPYLAYGIQLLPLTPISGLRDSPDWLGAVYFPFRKSCNADLNCVSNGWSILGLGILATIGHQNLALEGALSVQEDAFHSAGGNGHSRTNTLWFIGTRERIQNPLPLHEGNEATPDSKLFPDDFQLVDCYKPEVCTDNILDSIVDIYSCGQRIVWLMDAFGLSQKDACFQVASLEYPLVCGACNPYGNAEEEDNISAKPLPTCKPCSSAECASDLNRCPTYKHTFVCSSGKNRGGCRSLPWDTESQECDDCCELTDCPATKGVTVELKAHGVPGCPLCSQDIAHSDLNLCPSNFAAPYLCYEGPNQGGCSPEPWGSDLGECHKCCLLQPEGEH